MEVKQNDFCSRCPLTYRLKLANLLNAGDCSRKSYYEAKAYVNALYNLGKIGTEVFSRLRTEIAVLCSTAFV